MIEPRELPDDIVRVLLDMGAYVMMPQVQHCRLFPPVMIPTADLRDLLPEATPLGALVFDKAAV